MDKNTYKLLTPGPLTTTETVKEAMQIDRCTWDEDYKNMTQEIRTGLLKLAHADNGDYTTVLMQGSGTFGVESVLSGVISSTDKVLVLQNGAYSKRMVEMCDYHGIKYVVYEEDYAHVPDPAIVEDVLKSDGNITHISMVHSETTSGLLNDITAIGELAKKYNKKFIVDAMSSFGGVDINVPELAITYLVSSANKCIQGVPGFSFIIAKVSDLKQTKGIARSLSLDLYAQWETMEKDGGKWRFTSPTHVVAAFSQALKELAAEGGINARNARYTATNRALRKGMEELGFKAYIDEAHQGPIITTFFYPENCKFTFEKMYAYLKDHGYVIYPGKLTDAETFRLGNIGEIYMDDVEKILGIFKNFVSAEN
jgi:2-aminoethylphosphonate-pyruvate transaminase